MKLLVDSASSRLMFIKIKKIVRVVELRIYDNEFRRYVIVYPKYNVNCELILAWTIIYRDALHTVKDETT